MVRRLNIANIKMFPNFSADSRQPLSDSNVCFCRNEHPDPKITIEFIWNYKKPQNSNIDLITE